MNSFGFLVLSGACVMTLIIVITVVLRNYYALKKIQREKIRELGGERKLYETVYNSGSELYVVLGASDKIPRYVSGGSLELLGIKKADIMADVYALKRGVTPVDISGFEKEYSQWKKDSAIEREFEYVHMTSGDRKVGMASISYNRMDDSYCVFIRDITAEAGEKQRIRNELEQIRNMNKYRNEFISNISHEIRTPINSIQGQLKLVEMNASNAEEVKRYAVGITEQTNVLLGLLNDMFDISKLESGDVVLDNNEFDLMTLAQRMKEAYGASSRERGLEFNLEMSDFNVRFLMGDIKRLQQILIAFITHAENVTPSGGSLSLNIRQMNRATDKVNILFRIKDGGPRLTQHESAAMFEAGTSGNIALTVANQLIRVMGGQLMFDSHEYGNDFSIFFTFPLADRVQDMSLPIESAEELVNKEFTFDGCRILMAEDNSTNAEIAKELLEMMGAEVDIAENGAVALDKFMNGGVGRYHVILMDIQMPEMDGLETARRIRALSGAEAKVIPIFALSANAFVEDKNRSLAAGMNGHIAKPIDFEVLKAELAKYL